MHWVCSVITDDPVKYKKKIYFSIKKTEKCGALRENFSLSSFDMNI